MGKLALPRNNPEEVRSYQFFLEVAAPILAGTSDIELWLSEIPRVCHADPAIWHAIVSLGAVYESFTSPRPSPSASKGTRDSFVLRQFNLSIRCLTSRILRREDKWRALTASVIFTCVCIIMDLHREARLHIKAGCTLLREIQEDKLKSLAQQSALPSRSRKERKTTPVPSTTMPVSIAPLRAIVTRLEVHARALEGIVDLNNDRSMVAESETFNAWHFYQSPCSLEHIPISAGTPSTRIRYATQENIVRAHRASEALLNSLVIFSQEHVDEFGAVLTGEDAGILSTLLALQEPFTRCFAELTAALQVFELEMKTLTPKGDRLSPNLARAILTFKLTHVTTSPLLLRDFVNLNPVQRSQILAGNYKSIVEVAERILEQDTANAQVFTPSVCTTRSLYLVAQSGFPQSTRKRAVELLHKYPRREGLWDSQFAAAMAELVINREEDAGEDGETGHPLSQHYSKHVSFESERLATITMRTWQDWKMGMEGERCMLKW